MRNKVHGERKVAGRPSVGLVLSGGGARGLAHIGVLRVLEREGIPIDFLAGTSFGGLIAAVYAAGMDTADMEVIARRAVKKRHLLRMADVGMPRGGLMRGRRMLAFYKQLLGEKTFDDLRLPLAVVAVDLNTHQEVVMDSGPVAMAIRATTSLPGLFMPLEWDGKRLVDGGLLNNLPVDVCRRQGAEKVIAVDIGLSHPHGVGSWIGSHRWVPGNISYTLGALDDALYAMRRVEQDNKLRQYPPDLLIDPDLPTDINSLHGYNQVSELIAAGEQAAQDALPELAALVAPQRETYRGFGWRAPTRAALARLMFWTGRPPGSPLLSREGDPILGR